MVRRNTLRDFGKDTAGAITIEFVATLPLFLVALAFAFGFGQIFLAHQATVNNVRAASRYLSRVDLSNAAAEGAAKTGARNIILTGQIADADGPDYLQEACPNDDACINTSYQSSGSPTFTKVRIEVKVQYPMPIFSLLGNGSLVIPFKVVEDARVIGS